MDNQTDTRVEDLEIMLRDALKEFRESAQEIKTLKEGGATAELRLENLEKRHDMATRFMVKMFAHVLDEMEKPKPTKGLLSRWKESGEVL